MKRFALPAAVAALLLAAAGIFFAFYPPLPRDLGGFPSRDAAAERLRIAVAPGDSIDGWYLGGRAPAVVLLLHGYGRTHERMWRYGAFLEGAGYHLVLIDFRSSRRAGRRPTTLGHLERRDAQAALDWIRGRAALEGHAIGVLGESLGGSVALLLAAANPDVAAVVDDSGFATAERAIDDYFARFLRVPPWPFAPLARAAGRALSGVDPGAIDVRPAAAALRDRPVLFVHGLADRRVAPAQTEALWRAAGARHPFFRVAAAGHCEGCLRAGDAYRDTVLAFLGRHLLGAAASGSDS